MTSEGIPKRERTWDMARGRWHGILPALGLPSKCVNKKNQSCPLCGGKDRFRFIDTEGRGTYVCSQCGGGTGLTLLMKFNNWGFREAAMQIDKIVGNIPVQTAKPIDVREARKLKNSLWAEGYPVQAGDPVDLYLSARGLAARPRCLRTVFSLPYRGEPVTRHPAMLAMFCDADGRPNTLHRTWLTHDGRKAEVEQPRKMMPGALAKGGAIRLQEAVGEVLGVAEGVETALSAAALHGLPVWAVTSEGLMRAWKPPAGVRRVVIFGDADAHYVGQAAAYELGRRLSVEKLVDVVEVKIPDVLGTDWNDELMSEPSEVTVRRMRGNDWPDRQAGIAE